MFMVELMRSFCYKVMGEKTETPKNSQEIRNSNNDGTNSSED